MSTHYPSLRRPLDVDTVDWLTGALAGVMVLVQIGAVVGVHHLLDPTTVSGGTGTGTADAGLLTAPVIVAIAVAEALVILAVYRFWNRLPDWVRTIGYYALWSIVLGVVGVFIGLAFGWLAVAAGGGVVVLHRLFRRVDLGWITHNTIAAGLSVIAAAYLGVQVPPGVVVFALVLLIVWDHVAVFETGWMMELGGWAGSSRLPLYFIFPSGRRFDLDELRDFINAPDERDRPSDLAAVLGVGDVLLPALLTASVVGAFPGRLPLPAVAVAIGAVAGVVKLRSDMQFYDGGVPALPWIGSGAILGYVGGVLIAGLPAGVAVGVNSLL